ncbi:MAG TPA: hypothetical protein VKZ78_06765 [Sphingobacteriaceae bacterium]|nr:hypothetical protein [Sphingobacteriaceae bacterium]
MDIFNFFNGIGAIKATKISAFHLYLFILSLIGQSLNIGQIDEGFAYVIFLKLDAQA